MTWLAEFEGGVIVEADDGVIVSSSLALEVRAAELLGERGGFWVTPTGPVYAWPGDQRAAFLAVQEALVEAGVATEPLWMEGDKLLFDAVASAPDDAVE